MTVVSALSPISLTQFFYETGKIVKPVRLFFYAPGTENRVTVYSDPNLQAAHEQPVLSGGSGRVPPIYIGVDPYRVRIFDSFGSLVEDVDYLPGATGAAPGGGGGGELTPEQELQLLQTGDFVIAFNNGTTTRPGFVRANGGLIGPALYNGVGFPDIEMQSDDAYALFVHLWGQDAPAPNNVLEVTGGKGADADSDWFSLAKMIRLPDLRGRALIGIDGMGLANANRLNGVPMLPATGAQTKPGSYGGAGSVTLSLAQLPAHSHAVDRATTGISIDSGGAAAGTSGGAVANIQDAGALTTTHNGGGISIAANNANVSLTDNGHSHGYTTFGGVPAANWGFGAVFSLIDGRTTSDSSNITLSQTAHGHTVTDNGHSHTTGTHGHAQTNHSHSIPATTHTHTITEPNTGTGHSHTSQSVGSGAALSTSGPFSLAAVYIKL